MDFLALPGDGHNGAHPYAGAATRTGFGDDLVSGKGLAHTGPAFVLEDMLLELFPEVLEGGENGVGSSTTQRAQRAYLDLLGDGLDELQIGGRAFPAQMRSRISSMRLVPMRQGTHLPQLSDWVNCRK